jgi:hypothetical protein
MASKNANEGRMKPTYKELYIERDALFLRLKAANKELAELRQALTGRTMSCVWCNDTAKQRDEICEAVRAFAEQESKFAAKAFVSTTTTYGDERPRLWRQALRKLCRMVNVKP